MIYRGNSEYSFHFCLMKHDRGKCSTIKVSTGRSCKFQSITFGNGSFWKQAEFDDHHARAVGTNFGQWQADLKPARAHQAVQFSLQEDIRQFNLVPFDHVDSWTRDDAAQTSECEWGAMRLTHLLRFLIQALYIVEFSIKRVVYSRSRLFEDFQIWFLQARGQPCIMWGNILWGLIVYSLQNLEEISYEAWVG
jgi:hypothetical protein